MAMGLRSLAGAVMAAGIFAAALALWGMPEASAQVCELIKRPRPSDPPGTMECATPQLPPETVTAHCPTGWDVGGTPDDPVCNDPSTGTSIIPVNLGGRCPTGYHLAVDGEGRRSCFSGERGRLPVLSVAEASCGADDLVEIDADGRTHCLGQVDRPASIRGKCPISSYAARDARGHDVCIQR